MALLLNGRTVLIDRFCLCITIYYVVSIHLRACDMFRVRAATQSTAVCLVCIADLYKYKIRVTVSGTILASTFSSRASGIWNSGLICVCRTIVSHTPVFDMSLGILYSFLMSFFMNGGTFIIRYNARENNVIQVRSIGMFCKYLTSTV